MKKKMKRKLKIKWGHLFLFFLVVVCLFFLVKWIFAYPVQNIYIEGNNILKDQEIIELAGLSDYPSFLKARNKTLKENLLESPFIDKVQVKKKHLGQVYLSVEESRAMLINLEGNLVLSNLEVLPNERNLSAPVLINEAPKEILEKLVLKLSKLDNTIFELISEIEYMPKEKDKNRFAFYMVDGNLVYITIENFSKMDHYLIAFQKVECQRGIFNFDAGNHFNIKEEICGQE